jgi:hypothetical protein
MVSSSSGCRVVVVLLGEFGDVGAEVVAVGTALGRLDRGEGVGVVRVRLGVPSRYTRSAG